MIEPLLRREAVERLTGLSRSTIYNMLSEGRFPKQVRVGQRAVRWRQEEIQVWLRDPTGWPAVRNEKNV